MYVRSNIEDAQFMYINSGGSRQKDKLSLGDACDGCVCWSDQHCLVNGTDWSSMHLGSLYIAKIGWSKYA